MSAEEARRQAILKLGGLEQTKQAYRERTTIPSLESFLQDAHFGLRILARRPGSSIVIVLVLALGIGANTAMFSIVSAVLLRPLPYRNSDRLVLVWQSSKQHRSTGTLAAEPSASRFRGLLPAPVSMGSDTGV